jgi:hypothetical protein
MMMEEGMRVSGLKTNVMEKDYIHGQTVKSMKENM